MAGATLPGMDQGAGSDPLYQLGLQHGQQLAAIQPGDFGGSNPASWRDPAIADANAHFRDVEAGGGNNPLPQFSRSGSMQTMPRGMPAAGQQQPAPASYGFPPLPGGNIPGTNTQRTQALQTAMPFPGQQYDASGTRVGNPNGMRYAPGFGPQAAAPHGIPVPVTDARANQAILNSRLTDPNLNPYTASLYAPPRDISAPLRPAANTGYYDARQTYRNDIAGIPGQTPQDLEQARNLARGAPMLPTLNGPRGIPLPRTDIAGNAIDQRQFDAQGNRLPAAAPTMQDTNRALQNVINRNPSLGVGSLPDGMAFAPNSRIGENGVIDASMSPTRGAKIDAANMRMHDREGQRDAAFGLTQAGLPGGLARALTYGQPDRGMYNRVLPGLVGHGGGAGPEVDPKAQMAASLAHGLIQGLAQGDKDGKVDYWSKLPEMLRHIKNFSDQFDPNGTVAPGWGGNKPLPGAGGNESTPTAPSAPPPPVVTEAQGGSGLSAEQKATLSPDVRGKLDSRDRAIVADAGHQKMIDLATAKDRDGLIAHYKQSQPGLTDEQYGRMADGTIARVSQQPFSSPDIDKWSDLFDNLFDGFDYIN